MRPPELRGSGAAGAVLRWALLWSGWLWTARLGAQQAWDLAGGLALPALWWSVLLLAGTPAVQRLVQDRAAAALAPLAAALVAGAALGQPALLPAATVAWALAAARLGVPGGCAMRRGGGLAPAAGAALAAAVLAAPAWSAALLLVCAAGLRPAVRGRGAAAAGLPGLAMGLMMGTAWLGSDWCRSGTWPVQAMALLHLAVMGLLPALLAALRPWLPDPADPRPGAALMVLGGGCALLPGPVAPAAGMLLAAAGWAWWVASPRGSAAALHAPLAWLGPAALLAMGLAAPAWGPGVLAAAQAGLGLLALPACATWRHVRWRPGS